MVRSVFEKWENKIWQYRYGATLVVYDIHGGVPDDPKVAAGWIRSKFDDNEALIQEKVLEVMIELGKSKEEAVQQVVAEAKVNRFKRDEKGLYIEGRQIKAAIKEAISVGVAGGHLPKGKYGTTGKGAQGFAAEHVQVEDDKVHLGTMNAEIEQSFVHVFRGDSMKYEEQVPECTIEFTVSTDWKFPNDFWPIVWTIGQKQGLGAGRSQGHGQYVVTRWEVLN